jgi:tetratricopeptide (TPR) repeat protein/DNA-binding SARP family transcriptional activator
MASSPDPQHGRLHVSVFGGPVLRDGAAEIPLSQYQAALLGLVFAHGRPGITRSRLVWLLWEEDDSAPSRHRLSQLLYAIARKTGQSQVFVAQGELIGADEQVCSDFPLFDGFIDTKQVGAAAALLEKGLLSAISPPTQEMEDWTAGRTIGLRSRLRNAAAALWSEAEGTADWVTAREAAETLLSLDPDSESYLQCVMKARALCGAFEEAEAAYRSWAELVPPSVSAGAAPLLAALESWRDRGVHLAGSPVDPPFIGRRRELAALKRSVASRSAEDVNVVVVTGEPGIGKTRLVHEVCRDAIASGTRVLRSGCSSLEQEIPLNPLVDILRDGQVDAAVRALAEPWRSVIRDLLPETGGEVIEVPYLEPSAVSRRLYEAVRRLLREIAGEGALLWIDDVQWIDHTTAAALEFALRRWEGGHLTLVLSARAAEDGDGTPGLRLINGLRGTATTIHLEDLDTDDATSLAFSILGGKLPTSPGKKLLSLTGNVPLYIVEVAHELAQGRMKLDELDDAAATPVPVRIQKVVDERLSILAPVERWVLELIAVGIRLSVDVVGATIKEPGGVLLDALDRLMTLRLITAERQVVSCKHDLIRQGIYAIMSPVKRTALHRRIAESLFSLEPDHEPGQLALHFDRAGMSSEAFRFAKAAADRAEETGATQEAVRFLRMARRNAVDQGEATRLLSREAAVHFRRAELDRAFPLLGIAEGEFRVQGEHNAAAACGIKRVLAGRETGVIEHHFTVSSIDRLMEQCETSGSWAEYLEALEARLSIVEMVNDVPELTLTLHRLARIPPTDDPRVQCLTNMVRALGILFGDGAGSLPAAERAYSIARERGLRTLEARSLHRLLIVHAFRATLHTEGGSWILEEGLRLAATSDDVRRRYRLLEAAGLWNMETGDLETAEGYFSQAEAFLQSTSEFSDHLNIFGNLGELYAMSNQFDRALQYYEKGRLTLRPHDHWRLRQIMYGGLGYCALELGDLRLARECESKIEYTTEGYFDPWIIVLFKATLLRRRGEHDAAIEYLEQLAMGFENRFRLVAIKLRLLECQFCLRLSRGRALRIGEWLLQETERLQLPRRYREAERLVASLRG